MPSWNIHTAQVEALFDTATPAELGIADPSIFLFGNYLPDVYVGYMVPGLELRIDYIVTHAAARHLIPVPDADAFWDNYLVRRTSGLVWPEGPALNLTLGNWAHIVTDRFYNAAFREFWATHEVPEGDELRIRKQADFDLFGHYLGIHSHVQDTPELHEACRDFGQYRVLDADIEPAIAAADRIVAAASEPPACSEYQLLSAGWIQAVFDDCHRFLLAWLRCFAQRHAAGQSVRVAEIRAEVGLPYREPIEID